MWFNQRKWSESCGIIMNYYGRSLIKIGMIGFNMFLARSCSLPTNGQKNFGDMFQSDWPWGSWMIMGRVKRLPRLPCSMGWFTEKYRKTPYLMVKTMVSCKSSLKPIHWHVLLFFPRLSPLGWFGCWFYAIYSIHCVQQITFKWSSSLCKESCGIWPKAQEHPEATGNSVGQNPWVGARNRWPKPGWISRSHMES